MRKGNFTSEELDAIGRELLKAAALPADRVEEIADSPFLFRKTMARIEADKMPAAPRPRSLQRIALTGLAAVIFTSLAIAIFIPIYNPADVAEVNMPAPAPVPEPAFLPAAEVKPAPAAQPGHMQKASLEPAERRTAVKSAARGPQLKKPQAPTAEPKREFYALANVQSPEEAVKDAQVIRVEMPRSSLFALGADVPLENAAENIKTELLVGPDGVPRAIRFVE